MHNKAPINRYLYLELEIPVCRQARATEAGNVNFNKMI